MDNFGLILKKELTDIVRDKRSFIMLFIPILLFPVMFTLMGTQLKDNNKITVAVTWETQEDKANYDLFAESFAQFLDAYNADLEEKSIKKNQKYEPVEFNPNEVYEDSDAESMVKDGKAAGILSFEGGGMYFTPSRVTTQAEQKSAVTDGLINAWILSLEQGIASSEYGVDLDQLAPIEYKKSEDALGKGSSAIATIAPMILVMLILNGGVSVAVDLFTGEKERGTFESLLTTQTSRMSILAAKFTATLIVSLASMALSIAAYMISFKVSPSAIMMMGGGSEENVKSGLPDAVYLLGLLGVCLALSVFAVSLLTLIALHARTVKEAQSQTSLLTIFGSLLGGGIAFMNLADISNIQLLIPVYNVIVTIKLLFAESASALQVFVTMASCFVYSALLWFLSARLLRSEKLLRG